jgi:hypothetical protein
MQVEVTSAMSLVTIELQCKKGYADMYARIGDIPTTSTFSARAVATDENGKIARIMLEVETPQSIGVLILSRSTGASYRIWAFQTGSSVGGLPPIEKTSALIKAFNVVSQNTLDDLSLRLPRLLESAHDRIDGMDTRSSEREERLKNHPSRSSTLNTDSVTENVAFKKGREVIKEHIRSGETRDDPNVDPDLMKISFNVHSSNLRHHGKQSGIVTEESVLWHSEYLSIQNQCSNKNPLKTRVISTAVRPVKYELRLTDNVKAVVKIKK